MQTGSERSERRSRVTYTVACTERYCCALSPMAAGSSSYTGLPEKCWSCAKMGQVYFLCHRSACPGPRAKGQGRGQGPQEVLLCLCRKCAEKPCPFCGEGIVAQDLHPATVTHLTTLQTTCSSTGDMREELDADVDCNWWKEPRYPVLPHGGIWLQDGLQTLEFACRTCGAAFEALGHMEDGRLSVPKSRGGFLFDQNDQIWRTLESSLQGSAANAEDGCSLEAWTSATRSRTIFVQSGRLLSNSGRKASVSTWSRDFICSACAAS